MKVAIEETVEVSDEQRVSLANVLDGKESKRKAQRAEAREFIWGHGASWPVVLEQAWRDRFAPANPDDGYDDEDLLGVETSSDDREEDLLGVDTDEDESLI